MSAGMADFIPGTKLQWNWSPHSISLLKTCPRKYQLKKLEGYRGRAESVHPTFGIHYHKALENFDLFRAAGLDHEEALLWVLHFLLVETWDWESNHTGKNRETLVRSVIWYLESYADDAAKTVELSDGSLAVELTFQLATDLEAAPGYDFCINGRLDRLVNFGGDLFILDRKTTGSTLSSYYFDGYNPDVQCTVYTLAGQIVYNMPVKGIIIDAAQIAVGFTRFERGLTLRSSGQLDEFLSDFGVWMEVAKLYARLESWPMNETACGNFGGCEFKGVCNKDPGVRHLFLETDFEKQAS